MDKHLMRYIMKRQGDKRRDMRNNRKMRIDYEDYEDGRSNRDMRDEREDYDERDMRDGRRGVKGTGRSRSRRDRRDSRDYESDYDDGEDYRDYEDWEDEPSMIRLKKSDMRHWKQKMENADGTTGEHFDMQQVMHAAEKLGINFKHYDEKEFCLAMNMIYSDYCRSIKKYVSPDKEMIFCAEMARDFLDDPDGPEPSEKLALYYYCIASCDEV